MNQLLSFLLLSSFAFGQEFYSMITPIKTFTVKSAVSGEVVFVNKTSEKSYLRNSTVIKLDDSLDVVNLEQTKIKLANQKEIYAIENGILDSYNKVSSKTKIDKDAQKIKVLNIASNIADMEMQIANLENNIKKKTILGSNIYLSSVEVEVGDFVNAGSHIANTGSTGAVFGDHLHFGILIQGIEANPNEWLDYNWIKLNLTNTINSALKIINGNKNETKNTK